MKKKILRYLGRYDWKKVDLLLLAIVVILSSLGVFAVGRAGGPVKGAAFMHSQLTGLILGLFVVLVLTFLDYHFIEKFAFAYYIFGLLLVFATHTGLGSSNGTDAVRWIDLGPVTFQPTELMKIIYVLFMAAFYEKFIRKKNRFSTIVYACVITIIPMLLIVTQPDLSSSLVILFIMICLIFVVGTSYRMFLGIFGSAAVLLGGLFWYAVQPFSIFYKMFYDRFYQFRRIIGWLHPYDEKYAVNENYQQLKSIRSIAAGKLYGKYLGTPDVSVNPRLYDSVSVNESDFVWSVIGEEFGFLGTLIIIGLYTVLVLRAIRIAKNAHDLLGRLIAVGIAAMFMFQIFTNISVATFIFPNTGLPLPFLSNGLSSMLSSMIAVGLLMNISIQPDKSTRKGLHLHNSEYEEGGAFLSDV